MICPSMELSMMYEILFILIDEYTHINSDNKVTEQISEVCDPGSID